MTRSVVNLRPRAPGETDDTARIQAAIDSLGRHGGVVVFPADEYTVTSAVVLPADVVLRSGDDEG